MNDDEKAKQKLAKVAQQVNDICDHPEDTAVIVCPYCGAMVLEGTIFCCELLEKCIVAVMDAREKFGKSMARHWVN